jgi:hypothetical protein
MIFVPITSKNTASVESLRSITLRIGSKEDLFSTLLSFSLSGSEMRECVPISFLRI